MVRRCMGCGWTLALLLQLVWGRPGLADEQAAEERERDARSGAGAASSWAVVFPVFWLRLERLERQAQLPGRTLAGAGDILPHIRQWLALARPLLEKRLSRYERFQLSVIMLSVRSSLSDAEQKTEVLCMDPGHVNDVAQTSAPIWGVPR